MATVTGASERWRRSRFRVSVLPVGLAGGHGLLFVSVDEEGEGGPVGAAGGFDDVGVITLLRLVVEVGQVVSAVLGVLA